MAPPPLPPSRANPSSPPAHTPCRTQITIAPPFRSEDCSSAHASEAALVRVRKVLEAERQRLQVEGVR